MRHSTEIKIGKTNNKNVKNPNKQKPKTRTNPSPQKTQNSKGPVMEKGSETQATLLRLCQVFPSSLAQMYKEMHSQSSNWH